MGFAYDDIDPYVGDEEEDDEEGVNIKVVKDQLKDDVKEQLGGSKGKVPDKEEKQGEIEWETYIDEDGYEIKRPKKK